MRFHHHVILVACMVLGAAVPLHAEKRVALVVGNAAYREAGVPVLATPVNDARAMRDALKSLGFSVIYGEDLDQKGMLRAVGRFADRVADADVAIVYFAGHGATFGDTPYAVPVDAQFSSAPAAPYELVPVETLIGELRQARRARIVILDASRDNDKEQEVKQQAWRGGPMARGLAPVKNPAGLIIASATQYLATAEDGAAGGPASDGSSARHSVFTAALLNNIATPGVDLKDMLGKVSREVEVATSGRQRPEISLSMYTPYVLAPAMAKLAETTPGGAAAAAEAAQVWATVQNTTSLMVIDEFIRQFDDVPAYANLARARRRELARTAPRDPSRQGAMAVAVDPLRPATPPAEQERGTSLQDCETCPQMVVLPAGAFTMGSSPEEQERRGDEGPQHVVTIARPFAMGRYHVTRDQFAAFVSETGYQASTTCFKWGGGRGGSWRDPGFAQDGSHPVVCVSFDDANAYANWLAKKTGRRYRLPSEAEWEYAARGRTLPGAYPRFFFGEDDKVICRYANSGTSKCNDGNEYTSPVRHYPPNAFGLFDMAGNAWQWTVDCYHDSYEGAPADGSAWTGGSCSDGHVVRGGSWSSDSMILRAAYRSRNPDVVYNIGFRLAMTVVP